MNTRTRILVAAAGAALLAQCNGHPLSPLGDVLDIELNQRIGPLPSNEIDVLWVVDNSGSMSEEQAELGAKFDTFIDELVGLGADFNLAVITTDMNNPNESGRFQVRPGNSKQYRDGAGQTRPCQGRAPGLEYCADVTGPVISSRDYLIDPSNPEAGLDADSLRRDFRCIATVGDCGSGIEMGLDALDTALSPALLDNQNTGFIRDSAYLGVIFLTDEEDCSSGGAFRVVANNECYYSRYAGNLTPVEQFREALIDLKNVGGVDMTDEQAREAAERRVIVAGIIGPDDGRPAIDAPAEPSPSCSGVMGIAYASDRYRQFIDLFGERGVEQNICSGDFSPALRQIGSLIAANLNINCIEEPPEICEDDSDCADGVACQDVGEQGGNWFCSNFEVSISVQRSGAGVFSDYVGPGPAGNTEPAPDAQFLVDFDSEQCPTGVSYSFQPGNRPPPQSYLRVAYPIALGGGPGDGSGGLPE